LAVSMSVVISSYQTKRPCELTKSASPFEPAKTTAFAATWIKT
jgi:hypothetical protein